MNVWVGRLACVLALAISASCGGMAANAPAERSPADPPAEADPAVTPAPPTARPLSELDALEHDLAVSEHRLAQQLEQVAHRGPMPGADTPPVGTARPPPPGPSTPAPPPTGSPESPAEPTDSRIEVRSGSPCDLACRSLQSMKRAAAGICRIAGEAHARCTRARSRVGGAGDRVASAGCACF